MRTTLIAIGAATALAAPSGALAAGTPFMGGLTSQHEPVVVQLSRDARVVRHANIALDLHCSDGTEFTFTDSDSDLPVSRAGRFGRHLDTGRFDNGDGTTGRVQATVHGRVRAGGADVRGTWTMTITEDDGTQQSVCSSRTVRFHVHR
jgi:hypothetical protein